VHKATLARPDPLDQLLTAWRAADGDAEASQSFAGRLLNRLCVQGGPSQLSQDQVQPAKVERLRLSKLNPILAQNGSSMTEELH
jgi:hypothetical protein